MRRLDQQPKHRVKFWLEQDGCPVTDTTAAIAARKRAKLLGKDQGRGDEHTVSGILSGCLFTSVQEICDDKGHKSAGRQVSKSSKAADDPLWIFQPDAPTTIQGSSHLISLTNKRYKILQSKDHTKQPAGSSAQQQHEGATSGPSWAKLQEQLQDAGTAAVAEIKGFGDLVGRRVSVWWPDDKQYYHGLITDYYCHSSSSNSSSALHSSRSSPDPPEAPAANQANTKGPGKHSKLARAAAASKGKDTVPATKHQARPVRPPKSARSVESAPTDAAAAVSGDKIQKRGPGRPPKKLTAAAAGSLAADGSGGVKTKKRGSGRPPKNPVALLGAAASGSGITGSGGGGGVEKRGPGRPPKTAAAAKAAAAAPAAADTGSGSKKRGRPPKPRGEVVWGKHRIEYDDGEVELLDLSRETWHLTDDDLAAIKGHAKQQKQQASSSSSRKDVPLPAVGDDLITFAVDRPAAVGPLMAAKPSSTAAAANRCARGSRITKRKDTASESAPSSDPSSSEGGSSGAESDSDESSSEDGSSASEPNCDESSDADSDAADAEDSQGGDQQEKLFKRKREAVADPAGSGGKRSKAAATAAAVIAAAAGGSGGTPAESCEHVAAPAADTAAAIATEAQQDSTAAAATGTAAVGDTIGTAKARSSAPTPATSGTPQPATAAAAASSKPQQSAFLGVLSAGFRKFMVGGGSKVPAVAANNASRASLQAATAAAAAAAVSRAVAARAGSASVTAVKPTGRATSISPQPRMKAADTAAAATGPPGPAAAAARDDNAVAGMKVVSPIVRDVPAAAAAAAAASEVRTKTPCHSAPPHPAPATLAAADQASVSCTVSSPPPAGAAAAGLSTAVSMDPPISAAAAADSAAAVKNSSSSTGKIPVGSPAGNSDAARDSVAAVTDTNDSAAAAADLAAAAPEAEIAQPHQDSRCLSAAAAVTKAVVVDCWQHVPVLKAEAETGARTPGAASTAAEADDDGGAGRVWRGAGDFDGDAAAAVAAAAADVAAITPARKLLDELTARLGQMDAAEAAPGSSNSSTSTKAPMQMQMLVARDNMQFSLLTEQLTAGNRGHISNAAAAEHGSDAEAAKDSSCLAVLLVKLPAGFDRCSVAVQSSSRGLEVCYKAAERSSSEAAGLAAGAAVQDRNVNNMTVKDFTRVVHLPSDLTWIKGSTPPSAYGPGDGTSDELAALEEVAAPVTTAAEVVALLQYSSTWGKLMVLGKCCST